MGGMGENDRKNGLRQNVYLLQPRLFKGRLLSTVFITFGLVSVSTKGELGLSFVMSS